MVSKRTAILLSTTPKPYPGTTQHIWGRLQGLGLSQLQDNTVHEPPWCIHLYQTSTWNLLSLQCFDAVGWVAGRASGLEKTEWWGAGMAICLERSADLHVVQLMPLPLTVSCFSKIQTGFTFLIPAHPGSPGQRAVKRVCVCVCVHGTYYGKLQRSIFIPLDPQPGEQELSK